MARKSLARLEARITRNETHNELLTRLYDYMTRLCMWRLSSTFAYDDRLDALSFGVEQILRDFKDYPNTFLQKDGWICNAVLRHAQHYLERKEFTNSSLDVLNNLGEHFADNFDLNCVEWTMDTQSLMQSLTYNEQVVLAALANDVDLCNLTGVLRLTKSRISQIKKTIAKKVEIYYNQERICENV